MKIDCRDKNYVYDPNLVVIDADTGLNIEQVVAVDEDAGWIIVNVCNDRGLPVANAQQDDIERLKIYRQVRVMDVRNIPKDQRRGVINLTRPYKS